MSRQIALYRPIRGGDARIGWRIQGSDRIHILRVHRQQSKCCGLLVRERHARDSHFSPKPVNSQSLRFLDLAHTIGQKTRRNRRVR